MKRHWLKLTLLGVTAFIATLIATFPAVQAWQLLAPRLSLPATPYQLSGTIWSGHAGTLLYRSRDMGALQWQLAALPLLTGRVALQWALQQPDGNLSGGVSVNGNDITLRDVSGRLPASQLMLFNQGLPIAVDGELSLNFASVQLPDKAAPIIDGTMVWNRALLVAGQAMPLGDLKLTLQPGAQGGSEGRISDAGGPLEISGTVTLDNNRRYRIDAHLRARPSADGGLTKALGMLGRPDARGFVRLQYQGLLYGGR